MLPLLITIGDSRDKVLLPCRPTLSGTERYLRNGLQRRAWKSSLYPCDNLKKRFFSWSMNSALNSYFSLRDLCSSFNILLKEKRYKKYSICICNRATKWAENRRHNIEIYAVIRALVAHLAAVAASRVRFPISNLKKWLGGLLCSFH